WLRPFPRLDRPRQECEHRMRLGCRLHLLRPPLWVALLQLPEQVSPLELELALGHDQLRATLHAADTLLSARPARPVPTTLPARLPVAPAWRGVVDGGSRFSGSLTSSSVRARETQRGAAGRCDLPRLHVAGSDYQEPGRRTASITCTTPLPAIKSAAVTVAVPLSITMPSCTVTVRSAPFTVATTNSPPPASTAATTSAARTAPATT